MKDKVHIKILAVKKGMPAKKTKELIRTITEVWEETHPGEKLCCVPVEVDYDNDRAKL